LFGLYWTFSAIGTASPADVMRVASNGCAINVPCLTKSKYPGAANTALDVVFGTTTFCSDESNSPTAMVLPPARATRKLKWRPSGRKLGHA
jgi:hypothetical protein